MLGQLIDSMDDPEMALGLVTAFEEPSLLARLAAAAEAAGWPRASVVTSAVRGFLDTGQTTNGCSLSAS